MSQHATVLKAPPSAEPCVQGEDFSVRVPCGARLLSGEAFRDPCINARLYGPAAAPLVIVAGGISSGRKAWAADGSGWWNEVVAPGGGLDLDRWRVLAFDFAPGGDVRCAVSTHDQARAAVWLLDTLGVKRARAWVGSSYGGMAGLAFAGAFPERLEQLCVISAAEAPSAMSVAWRGIQRRMVEFATAAGRPQDGLALARQLAMTTYRSAEEFDERFDCAFDASGQSDLCRYLVSRGEVFRRAMPADRWWSLSRSLDSHQVAPADIRTPTTLIASTTDQLIPLEQMRRLAERLPCLQTFEVIDSRYGHDAFLKEAARLKPILRNFLNC